jgi:hypothetical protein
MLVDSWAAAWNAAKDDGTNGNEANEGRTKVRRRNPKNPRNPKKPGKPSNTKRKNEKRTAKALPRRPTTKRGCLGWRRRNETRRTTEESRYY